MRWQVTGQRPVQRTGPNLTVMGGYEVTVTTDTGHTDTVFVPAGQYTPEGVAKVVNDTLAKVAQIDGLTGEV